MFFRTRSSTRPRGAPTVQPHPFHVLPAGRSGTLRAALGLLAGLAVAGTGTAALAEDHAPIGSSRGATYRTECPPGAVLIGLDFRAGAVIDGVTAVCATHSAPASRTRIRLGYIGGGGGTERGMQCPIGSAIREIEVHYNLNVRLGGGRQGTVVTMVVARCYSFADGRRTETLRIDRSDALPSEGANRRTCSRGLWATGIIGRTGGDGARLAGGTLLDALGMVCGPWQLQSTAIPPPDRTPPPQTPNPAREQRVVLPVDVYNQPGGTVTGFLAAGTVLVLPGPCRADNWCQVTGNAVPQGTGWVFSGPSYNALGL